MSSVNAAWPVTLLFQMLLAIAFCAFATASSVANTTGSQVEAKTNDSFTNKSLNLQHVNILHRREGTNSRSNIVYGSTCSGDQVTYIDTSMNEAKDLAVRGFEAVAELLEIMRQKEEPSTWPAASYTRRSRNLLLWNSLFGEPSLGKVNGKSTLAQTISQMVEVKNSYNRLKIVLNAKKDKLYSTINCADGWLVYLNNNAKGERVYQDKRHEDRIATIVHAGTCNEKPEARAYSFTHQLDKKQETVYCPRSFDLWSGKFLADIQSSSFAALRGKAFKYVKEYALAGTVVHETTHYAAVMGDLVTDDVIITYNGERKKAYGSVLCRELARNYDRDGQHPQENADTLALFALGVYFSQCNWANENSLGKCSGDSPDTICPTNDDGQRECVKFFS